MSINIKPSRESKFHEWAKVRQGREIPMSKIVGTFSTACRAGRRRGKLCRFRSWCLGL
jgi:hypothetical protein